MGMPLVLTGAVLLFALQMLLLAKSERMAVRLIPAYLVCAMLAYAAATYFGAFGVYSAGAISGNELAGLVLLMISGVEAVGPLLAWAVYGIALFFRRRREKVS